MERARVDAAASGGSAEHSGVDRPWPDAEFLHAVLDGLSAHVCVLDERGFVVHVNRAWRDFARANAAAAAPLCEGADYLGVCDRALAATADGALQGFTAGLREMLQGLRFAQELEYACHAGGLQRWFVARASRLRVGDRVLVVVAHDDVSTLKKVQEELRESQALLTDLAASMPGAVFRLVHRGQGNWDFVYLSPGVERLFGVAPAGAYADRRALWATVVDEDREALDRSGRAAVASGSAWDHEFRLRMPDGSARWVHARALPQALGGGGTAWTGVFTDISARRAMEAALRRSEETYRTLFETVPLGVVYQDLEGRIVSANPAAERILGLPLTELRGRTSLDPRWRTVNEDGTPCAGEEHPSMRALRSGRPVNDVVLGIARPDGEQVWILVNAAPVYRDGRMEQVYSTFEDITQRTRLALELRLQATTDYLTGVANRRSLMDRLDQEFERMMRHPQTACSVLTLDIDLFKQVNDRYGHAAGDAVLVHLARLMRQATRHNDLVGRTGGEEFAIVLPDTPVDDALPLAERLRGQIEQAPAPHAGRAIPFSVSIGLSAMNPHDASAGAALLRADHAMYEAKAAGRNKVRVNVRGG